MQSYSSNPVFPYLFAASQLTYLAFGSPIDSSLVEDSSTLQARAPTSFNHPGVVSDKEQLDFVKSKVNAREQPWTDAYKKMLSSNYASTTHTQKPRASVEYGPTSTPDLGYKDEREDDIAAYNLSLAWYITGTAKYAQKAIDIITLGQGPLGTIPTVMRHYKSAGLDHRGLKPWKSSATAMQVGRRAISLNSRLCFATSNSRSLLLELPKMAIGNWVRLPYLFIARRI